MRYRRVPSLFETLLAPCLVAAFVLGPQKLADLAKDAGKSVGELQEVPKGFKEVTAPFENYELKAYRILNISTAIWLTASRPRL